MSRHVPAHDRRSRSLAIVVVQHAAEALTAHDAAAVGCIIVHRHDELVADSLVIAFCMIVIEKLLHDLPKVTLTERDGTRKTLASC